MVRSPFRFEDQFDDGEFRDFGKLSLRWSHIEHIIGNCLKVMMRLSDDEAIVVVFPLNTEQRLGLIRGVAGYRPLSPDAERAFAELELAWRKIEYVRNVVVHAVINEVPGDAPVRLVNGPHSKEDIFVVEELTNYAAHAALTFRHALGLRDSAEARHPLPARPEIPAYLAAVS